MVGEIGLIYSSEISDQPDQNTDLSVERGKLFAIKSILLSFSRTLVDSHRFFFNDDRPNRSQNSKLIYRTSCLDCPSYYVLIGKTKKRLHGRKTAHFNPKQAGGGGEESAPRLVLPSAMLKR